MPELMVCRKELELGAGRHGWGGERRGMKAITLTQPWATLVAIGAKKIETRSWATGYRGRLAIHAAKGASEIGWPQLNHICRNTEPFRFALKLPDRIEISLPLGAICCHLRTDRRLSNPCQPTTLPAWRCRQSRLASRGCGDRRLSVDQQLSAYAAQPAFMRILWKRTFARRWRER